MDSKNRVSQDPGVWWATACQDMEAAMHNYKGGFSLVALGCCQGAVEKALKGYCANAGIMDDSLATHRLRTIAEKAGLYASMPEAYRGVLVELSGLHEASSYPVNEVQYRALNDERYACRVLTVTQRLFMWIKDRNDEQFPKPRTGEGA